MKKITWSLKKLNVSFVFRYRYEKLDDNAFISDSIWRRDWRLGIFFRKYVIVFDRKGNKFITGNSYMLGIDLLIFKMWMEINYGSKFK